MIARINDRSAQSGAVLFIALVFLVLITLMAVTTFTISKSTSQVVDNMDLRRATLQAAAQTNEQVLSSTRVIKTPTAPLPGGLTAVVDVKGDGKENILTTVAQPINCFMAYPKEYKSLDLTDPVEEQCAYSISTGQKCYKVTFQYTVTAQEELAGAVLSTGAQNSVSQGVYVTADPGGARNVCHGPGGTLLF
jgi:archaellum component FlaG (FlaF/FlaG flagellin family)